MTVHMRIVLLVLSQLQIALVASISSHLLRLQLNIERGIGCAFLQLIDAADLQMNVDEVVPEARWRIGNVFWAIYALVDSSRNARAVGYDFLS